MTYSKVHTFKIVRTVHQVTLRNGTTANGLSEDLCQVPADATITDIETDEDSGTVTITFQQEEVTEP